MAPLSAPETCNCTALRQAARHVSRWYDEALAATGIGVNQYAILAKLGRFGPQSVQALADILVTDRSSLGHLLRPLELRRLVDIKIAIDDRRRRIVTLTADGQVIVAACKPLWEAAQQRFEQAYGAEKAGNLRVLLRDVTETGFVGDA